MTTRRAVRIGVIGDAAMAGDGRLLGAAGLAARIQEFGDNAALAALVPANDQGAVIRAKLTAAGVDISRVESSERATLRLGDRIDVAGLFDMDAVLLAVSDPRLHRFLVDLPVHTAPNARLIGVIDHLAAHVDSESWETAMRHDAIMATLPDIQAITGECDANRALDQLQRAMTGHNLRAAAVIDPRGAATILTKTDRVSGAADSFERFAAATTVVFARRDPWSEAFEIADS
jgi:sugar/nucleoside kinase (ribokinase family)